MDNLRHPDSARYNGVQGWILVQFVVNENGAISEAKVIKGIGHGCDEEALRLIETMPRWKPAEQDGRSVKMRITQPIKFILE